MSLFLPAEPAAANPHRVRRKQRGTSAANQHEEQLRPTNCRFRSPRGCGRTVLYLKPPQRQGLLFMTPANDSSDSGELWAGCATSGPGLVPESAARWIGAARPMLTETLALDHKSYQHCPVLASSAARLQHRTVGICFVYRSLLLIVSELCHLQTKLIN